MRCLYWEGSVTYATYYFKQTKLLLKLQSRKYFMIIYNKCGGMIGMDDENVARTVKCFKCGAEVPEGSKFCNFCGAALSMSCPFCGKQVTGDSRFCNYCGKELTSAPKPPAEDFVYVDATGTALKGFFICTHQVTQDEYQKIMGRNPSNFSGGKNPVEQVSWYDCIEYCNERSLAEGLKPYYNIAGDNTICNEDADGYRLPTEAEWKYAARGGNRSHGYKYSGSNEIDEVAWCKKNSDGHTHPVCMKKPNELGIYDMSGNVFEWCWDRYWSSRSPRVLRGGSWYDVAGDCSVFLRGFIDPSSSDYHVGFRLARSAQD